MIDRFFEDGWQIWRPTLSQDLSGGPVQTFALVGTIRGRMRPRSLAGSSVAIAYGRERLTEVHRFYCAAVDIRAKDELRKDGKSWRVLFPSNIMQYGQHYEVDCEAV